MGRKEGKARGKAGREGPREGHREGPSMGRREGPSTRSGRHGSKGCRGPPRAPESALFYIGPILTCAISLFLTFRK